MRAAVRLIDIQLRITAGLFEFSQDPDCLLRLQYRSAPYTVTISGETIVKGDPVLGLHAWNERMPKLPATGADLAWALQFRRRSIQSFIEVAAYMQTDPRCERIRAVYGASALFSFSDHIGGLQMMQHLGFTVLPYHRPLGRFGEFWENLFSWWMMWTFNDTSLDSRKFWHLQRTEIWMTRTDFVKRYGKEVISQSLPTNGSG